MLDPVQHLLLGVGIIAYDLIQTIVYASYANDQDR